jgi:hypothetical protein
LAESLERKIGRRTSLCMILAFGRQSWMVICTKLSGAVCLADILIITLPHTLAHVMEYAVAASSIHLIKDAGPCGFWHRSRRAQSQTELIISAMVL